MVRPIFRGLAFLPLFSLLALLVAAPGCGDDAAGDPDPDSGMPSNEPKAGFEFREAMYTVPGTAEARTLRLNLWYATDETEGEGAVFNSLFGDTDSLVDANVVAPAGQAPLMVYSHGDQAWGGSNHRLARRFVEAGWIVVAPDHTGNVLLGNTQPRPFEFDILRAYDVKETIDHIENLPMGHPLAGHVDTSRVLVVGHSYGGQTAWLTGGPTLDQSAIMASCAPGCVQGELDAYAMYAFDPRVVGVLPLDGGVGTNLVSDAGFSTLNVPVLYMTTGDNSGAAALFARSTATDVTWVQFEEGCHESFTGTIPCASLDMERSIEATATFALAFGAMTVEESSDPEVLGVLDGSMPVDDFVTLMHHPASP